MLTPKTGLGAGILHKNSIALAQRGPWRFAAVTWGDAVEGPADGEPTGPQHKARCETCEVCSAAIVNIVDRVEGALVVEPRFKVTAMVGIRTARK